MLRVENRLGGCLHARRAKRKKTEANRSIYQAKAGDLDAQLPAEA